MKEINLVEFSQWFEDKTRKKIEPLKKEAEKRLLKCQSIFDELKIASKTLEEQTPSTSDELIVKSAKRFSENVVKKLDEIKFPDKISYDEIEYFNDRLEDLLNTIMDYGRRWISKLGRDKAYLQSVRDINFLLKDLHNLYKKFLFFLESKYRQVKNIENLELVIDRLKELTEEAKKTKASQSEIENKINKNENELKEINDKIQSLAKDEVINQLNLIDQEIEQVEGNIKDIIGTIRKPLKKISKLIESGEFVARSDSVSSINEYLNKPIKTFLSEDDNFSHIKAILNDLNDAIDANKLKLKSTFEKKIKNKIKEFEDKGLISLKSQLNQLNTKKESLFSNVNYKNKLLEMSDLKQKKEFLMRESEDIRLQLEKNNEDYNRILNKIGENKTKIENSIVEITDTQIKLII